MQLYFLVPCINLQENVYVLLTMCKLEMVTPIIVNLVRRKVTLNTNSGEIYFLDNNYF